jgi:beta-galactosidase
MVRLWSWEALAHGADVVSYFPWRQLPYAQEQHHAALLRCDGEPAAVWPEIEQVARELRALDGQLQPSAPSPVALVFDYQAAWTLAIQPQGKSFSYPALVYRFYTALRRLGVDVDVVLAGRPLDGYRLVVVPTLPMLDDAALTALSRSAATVVLGPRTGSKTLDFAIPARLGPGELQDVLPLQVTQVESLPPGVADELSWSAAPPPTTVPPRRYPVTHWREHLTSALPASAHFSDGRPAAYRSDRWHYLGFWPDEAFLMDYLESCLGERGVATTRLPDGLRLRRRGDLVFAFNVGDDAVSAPAPEGAVFVIGQRLLRRGELAAWRA